MNGTIGYYVHHHGGGHRQRALAIANAAPGRFMLIGTGLRGRTGDVAALDLPDDRLTEASGFDGEDDTAERPQALHYAPLHHDGVRRRAALVASWIEQARPSLMVVDVSVEIAMLARLAATPTVYVRLGGLRTDVAHLEAFRGAKALLSPFHADLDESDGIRWVHAKTRFFPGLTMGAPSRGVRDDTVLIVNGLGAEPGDGERLADLARALPQYQWRAIGPICEPVECPPNLTLLGWIEDAEAEIATAGIVVGAAGDGLVTEVAAVGRPFICLAQPRPFDEQGSKARRLRDLGAAVVLEEWPAPSAWLDAIEAARGLRPEALTRLHDPRGVRRAADFLIEQAKDSERHAPT